MRINNTSAMPIIANQKLKTLLLFAMVGVDLVKKSSAPRNGDAKSLTIFSKNPVTVVITISIKPLFAFFCLIACNFGIAASAGFCGAL